MQVDRKSETDIIRMMCEIGMPLHLSGCKYLRDAVIMAAKDEYLMEAVTKELYPAVAKLNGSTTECVERAIRYAIKTTWDREEEGKLEYFFSHTRWYNKKRPSNSELIAVLADKLRNGC